MKHLFLLLLLLNSLFTYSQDYYYDDVDYKGDTTKLPVYENPTVCDCHHASWKNNAQKKICAQTYDYDFMSEDDKANYDTQLETCRYPSICDCASISSKDKGMTISCDENFNYSGISEQTLKENIKRLAECPKKEKKNQDAELSICDCINVSDIVALKECNKVFFNDSLSEEQIKENSNLLLDCIKSQTYEIEVSTCDCALFSETDEEYKKLCDEKIEELKQNKRDLTAYLYSLKVCKETAVLEEYLAQKNNSELNYAYSVCGCNEEELNKETIEKCNTIWDYKTMTKEQQEAFSNAVERCNK